MTIKITGNQNRPVQPGTEKSMPRARDGATGSTESAKQSSPVRITDQARRLATLEQAVQSTPVVNEARVMQISSAIEEGRYEIVPERIVEKMMRMDQELKTAEK